MLQTGSTLINTIDFESTTTSIDVSVENNTIYYWKVVATDAEGNQMTLAFTALELTRLFCFEEVLT